MEVASHVHSIVLHNIVAAIITVGRTDICISGAKINGATLHFPENLVDWEKTWQMEFHPDKCEIISITRKRNPVKYPYTLHGHLLKHVDVVKYLGENFTRPPVE